MDINKVNEAVKLFCQIESMRKKLGLLRHKLTNEEYNEYLKRIK